MRWKSVILFLELINFFNQSNTFIVIKTNEFLAILFTGLIVKVISIVNLGIIFIFYCICLVLNQVKTTIQEYNYTILLLVLVENVLSTNINIYIYIRSKTTIRIITSLNKTKQLSQ